MELGRQAGFEVFKIGDDGRLPFGNESFDATICIEVLEHLFSPQDLPAEIRRVLRHKGTLLVTVPNCAYWRRRVDIAVLGRWNPLGEFSVEQPWRDPHIRFFTQGALQRLLRFAQFDNIRIGGHGGSLIRDIPYVHRYLRVNLASPLDQMLELWLPSLFGNSLHGIASVNKLT